MTKEIEDAAKFLHDNGLLFEINRLVLHPRGLALGVITSDDERIIKFDTVFDYREDGINFGPSNFVDGERKLTEYTDEHPKVNAPQTNPDGSGIGTGPS
jgi:hypothetical protein